MTLQDSKTRELYQVVDQLVAAWNSHDVERVAALYAPNYEGLDVGEAQPQRGPDSIRRSLTRYLSAFPDLRLEPEQKVVQDNRVAFSWVVRGTHKGAILNIPPTGREISVRGMSIVEIVNGQVTRAQSIWDMAGLLREMGLLPEL